MQRAAGSSRGSKMIVPFVIDLSLEHLEDKILDAMEEIQNHSVVRFDRKTHDDDRRCLEIKRGNGCHYNPYHCTGNRPEHCRPFISLGDGCESFGTILHELMHAIGFEHEHQRPDRDEFITIHWNNIGRGNRFQFEKLSEDYYWWPINDFDFDYASIMMYGEHEFSTNTRKTVEAHNGRPLSGSKNRLSKMDKEKLSLL